MMAVKEGKERVTFHVCCEQIERDILQLQSSMLFYQTINIHHLSYILSRVSSEQLCLLILS
jgi:hypothetical protein